MWTAITVRLGVARRGRRSVAHARANPGSIDDVGEGAAPERRRHRSWDTPHHVVAYAASLPCPAVRVGRGEGGERGDGGEGPGGPLLGAGGGDGSHLDLPPVGSRGDRGALVGSALRQQGPSLDPCRGHRQERGEQPVRGGEDRHQTAGGRLAGPRPAADEIGPPGRDQPSGPGRGGRTAGHGDELHGDAGAVPGPGSVTAGGRGRAGRPQRARPAPPRRGRDRRGRRARSRRGRRSAPGSRCGCR